MHYIPVRLTRKLAERINGFDLSGHQVGDMLRVPSYVALMLMGEGWATPLDPAAVDSGKSSSGPPARDADAPIAPKRITES